MLVGVGWRPVLSGSAVLIIAAIAGWGIAADANLAPVRWIARWVDRVIVPCLRAGWLARTLAIFVNNAANCALMIAAGALPAGSWASVTVIGLAMGFAVRHLGRQEPSDPNTDSDGVRSSDASASPYVNSPALLGLLLNLLELPAIALCVGLSIGQVASEPHLSMAVAWSLYVRLVLPALLIAACGESTWIGHLHPFEARDRA